MYVCIGMLFHWYGYFRGVAKPHISLIPMLASLGTRVVLSYMLASHTAFVGAIWISTPIGWIFADILGFIFYRREELVSVMGVKYFCLVGIKASIDKIDIYPIDTWPQIKSLSLPSGLISKIYVNMRYFA